MFSLIITIISIALVAALALATLYYGGSAFNRGSTGATAARLINEGQQINGAVQIAKADFASESIAAAVVDVDGLVAGKYLAQLPSGWDGAATLESGLVMTAANVGIEVCDEVNKRAKLTGAVTETSGIYGCVQSAQGVDGKVFYNF